MCRLRACLPACLPTRSFILHSLVILPGPKPAATTFHRRCRWRRPAMWRCSGSLLLLLLPVLGGCA